jgi:hypothetical protein
MSPRQRIDCIVYLASLISEPRSVDSVLDKLRLITTQSAEPSTQDAKVLQVVQQELEDYLLHRERLRSFNAQSLEATIDQFLAVNNPAKLAKTAALKHISITVGIAALITAVCFASGLMKGQIVLAFFIFTLFTGLAFIFQSVKKNLVAQLQGSVSYLMAATIGTGLFALNFPVISQLHLDSHPFFQHGGFLEAAIPVYACYYIAFYLYAKQLDVAIPRLLRPLGAVITAVVITVIAVVVPHPVHTPDELYFDLALVGFAVSVYFSAIAAVLGFMTLPKTTAQYNKIMVFLSTSMVMQTLGNGFFLIFVTYRSGDFMVNDPKGQTLTAFLILTALVLQYIAAYKSKTSLR